MIKSAGKRGFYLRKTPKEYRITKPQLVLKEVARECGIEKGISKKDLQEKMVNCVGPRMREIYSKKHKE